MKIEEVNYKIACDMPGCVNLAKYSLNSGKTKSAENINLCSECVKNLYENIGKYLIPKSPKNILNNNTKRGK